MRGHGVDGDGGRPFVLLASRQQDAVADEEYGEFCRFMDLPPERLRRIRLERGPMPQLDLDEIAGAPFDFNGNGTINVGDTVAYQYVVTNIGTVTLTNVAVDDGLADTTISCPATTLAPGASTTCTATHAACSVAASGASRAVASSASSRGVWKPA